MYFNYVQLYLIWFGDQDVDENETSTGGSLGEVAIRSGGEILRVTEESFGNGEMGLVIERIRLIFEIIINYFPLLFIFR